MSVRKIIDETIEKLRKSGNNFSSEKIESLREQADHVDSITNDVEDACQKAISSAVTEFERPMANAEHIQNAIDEFTVEAPHGKLIDPCTYWWRGLPVNMHLTWIGGCFRAEIVRQSDNKVVGEMSLNMLDIFSKIEEDDEKCQQQLGADYGHMYGIHVDLSDSCDTTNFYWKNGI